MHAMREQPVSMRLGPRAWGHRGFVGLASLVLASAGAAQAQPAADFMRAMPSAAQVLRHFGGDPDPIQSLGRQCAALDMIERSFFRNAGLQTRAVAAHAATRAVRLDYTHAFKQLRERYEAAAAPMDDARRQRWSRMCERGGQGVLARPVTRDELWAMLDPGLRAVYDQSVARGRQLEADRQATAQRAAVQAEAQGRVAAARAQRAAEERRQTQLTLLVVGVALLGLGSALVLFGWRGNRRLSIYEFENRSDGGVVGFESYDASLRHNRRRMVYTWAFQIGALVTLAGLGCAIALATT